MLLKYSFFLEKFLAPFFNKNKKSAKTEISLSHGLFNGINELVASLSSYQVRNMKVIWEPGLLPQTKHQRCTHTALQPSFSRTDRNINSKGLGLSLKDKEENNMSCLILITPFSKGESMVKFFNSLWH